MARPQSPNFDDRRRAIVDAAAALYADKGFQGSSVAELARACNTAKSLIYHYFPSKHDVLLEVMADHLDALVEAAREATAGGSPEEQLRALIAAFMDLYAGAQHRHTVLLNELDQLPEEPRRAVIAKQREIIAIVERVFAEVHGGTAEENRALTMLFFGMINWTHTWYRPEGPVSPDRLSGLAAQMVLGGIRR